MDELVQQVKILVETQQTMIARSEQLYKMQEEKSAILNDVASRLAQVTDALLVTDEALKRSLSDSDQQIDDLASVTAALLQIQQTLQAQQQATGQ